MHSQTLLVPLIILSHNHQNHNYRLMGPCFLHTTTTTNKIICKVANKQVITFSRLQWLQTAIARHSGGYFIQQFANIYKNVQLIMHRNMELSNLYMNTNTRVFVLGSISASFISLLHNQEYSQNCKWVASYLAYTNRLNYRPSVQQNNVASAHVLENKISGYTKQWYLAVVKCCQRQQRINQ